MTRYARGVAWVIAASYLLSILAAIGLGAYLLSLPVTVLTVLLMAATAIFIATRLRGLQNIIHECSHSTFSEHRQDNVVIGQICAALLFRSFRKYRDDHLSHHANNGDYESDADFASIQKFRLEEPLSLPTVLRHIATPLLGLHLSVYAVPNFSREDGNVYFALKIALVALIGAVTVLAPLTSLIFVIAPLFYIFPTLNYWTDCFDHAGLVGAEDELQASRNVLAPAPLRWLFFPRNDSYHLVHHLFPQIPARHLDHAHKVLSEDAIYAGQREASLPVHRSLAQRVRPENARKGRVIARKQKI